MRSKILALVIGISAVGLAGFLFKMSSANLEEKLIQEKEPEQERSEIVFPDETVQNYQSILSTEIKPMLAPDYEFPTDYQYLNGCFGFAVGHILMDRGWDFDMLEMEERIQKPREVLWNEQWRQTLAEAYHLELKSYKDPALLFRLLEEGESVVLRYEYPLEDGEWILHAVAAYSFDENGIWVSDSLAGDNILIPYDQVFTEKGDETLHVYTRVIEP